MQFNIGIEQEKVCTSGKAGKQIVPTSKAKIPLTRDNPDVREIGPDNSFGGAVALIYE